MRRREKASSPTGASSGLVRRLAADLDTPVYWRPDLLAGFSVKGPAIVEQFDSTTVVPPGFNAVWIAWLNIILRLEA